MSYEHVRKPHLMTIITAGGFSSATLCLLPLVFPSLVTFLYFTSLPLFLLGLGIGMRALIGAGIIATACIFLFQGPLLFFLLSFLGTTFFVRQALVHWKRSSKTVTWYPASFLLRDATLFSGLIMILILGIYLYLNQGGNLQIIAKNIVTFLEPHTQIEGAETLLINMLSYLPGLFTFSWMLMMLLNAWLAQKILIRTKTNLRPTPSLAALQLPKSFLIVLALSLCLAVIGVGTLELLGKNAALTLSFPFFVSGLGIVHSLFHKTAFGRIGLTVFYFALLFLLWPILFVIILGILRPWVEKLITTN